MHEPSASRRRPFLGCLIGTFTPSRRHSRSIRPSLAHHPASRSGAAIRRYPHPPDCPVNPTPPRPAGLHQHGLAVNIVIWNGADLERGKHGAARHSGQCAHDRDGSGGGRGSGASPVCARGRSAGSPTTARTVSNASRSFGQDELVEGELEAQPAKAPVLFSQPQRLDARFTAHATTSLATAVVRLLGHTDPSDRNR